MIDMDHVVGCSRCLKMRLHIDMVFFLQGEDGIRDIGVTGVQTCALPILLSFVYLGIYWNNHHHLFQVVDRVTGGILWANLHLLFWLSLVPFVTNWMGEHPDAPLPKIGRASCRERG